jgi:hypothetical protein
VKVKKNYSFLGRGLGETGLWNYVAWPAAASPLAYAFVSFFFG